VNRALVLLSKRLARVSLVSPERDLIERLDRLEVANGTLEFAATSAPDIESTEELVRALREAAPELDHGLRVVADDRPELLGAGLVARALRQVPAPLPLAFTWRKGDRAPPDTIPRLSIGPLLGYPKCCVKFEEARRKAIVVAEARGMTETWHPRRVEDVVLAITERRPFLAEDVGDEEGREERLRSFPFVSYVPCPSCCKKGQKSPAGRDDARRRKLAESISSALAKKIERVRGSPRINGRRR
jgi:hypothetical protein